MDQKNGFTSLYKTNEEQLAYCSADERQMLASYFLSQGERMLLKGDITGLNLFDYATELDGCNPELFYRQGLALFEYSTEDGKEKALLLSGKKFKTAATLCPDYFEAWQLWGMTLSLLGNVYREHHYYLEAEEKLQKAIALSGNKESDLIAELFWDYGVVWTRIGEHSGEAIDLQKAINAFQKAAHNQEHLSSEFWNDYGIACMQMAALISDIRLNVKAIGCFKHAVALSVSSYEGWIYLAGALEKLYTQTHDDDHFTQANECYSAAAHLRPNATDLWLKWASFLCESGRRTLDLKRLRAAVEKCQRAYVLDQKQPRVSAIWAEGLALIGEQMERIDFINEAQNKMSEALDLSEEDEDPEIWYSYGMCLTSFARYFEDPDYYYQAIEKFQYGLSIDRTSHKHWHAIAKAYSTAGALVGDANDLEKAIRFYLKALNLHPCITYTVEYAIALTHFGEMKDEPKALEEAIEKFEHSLTIQKNALYIHPEWFFHYAKALDLLGNEREEESYYLRAIEILSHVLMIDPDFPGVHHHLGLTYTHLADLNGEIDHFYRATHHFRLAHKYEDENDIIIIDWGICLINLAQHVHDSNEADLLFRDAEHKLQEAAKLGNMEAFYSLACLHSLMGHYETAMRLIEKCHASNALPSLNELLEDEWLEGLRNTSFFQDFLVVLNKNS
jgi:tetratricopeptide (TPR) repeat protein